MSGSDGGVVYSTQHGPMCPRCSRPRSACACREAPGVSPGDGVVRVRRETKGRGGKTVTTVLGLPLERGELARLGKELRRRCGTGGTARDGVVELQGDHRDVVVAELERRGFVVVRAGG